MNYRSFLQRLKIQTYNIGFVTKTIDCIIASGLERGDIHWMVHTYKDRFFADPFLWKRDNDYYYILCEEFLFFEEKGRIILIKVRKNDYLLCGRKVIIEEPTHLSFPFCEENGDYIIPESVLSGKCMKYKLDSQDKIIKKYEVFQEGLIDTVFYKDDEGREWMLTAKNVLPSTELYIYYKENGKYKSMEGNPVVSNNRITRSAGVFFKTGDRLYRPVQDCLGRYGRQTKIMRVDISDGKMVFQEEITLNSFDNPPFDETMHTFNVYEDIVIVDGSKDYFRPFSKLLYKKLPYLFYKRLKNTIEENSI